MKISQFADDTTIITDNPESLKSHLRIIELFGNVSGLKLNEKKTKAMWLGTMKNSNSKVLRFKTTKDPIKVLGTFLSYNEEKNIEENFIKRIRRMKVKLNLWLSRDLTLYGKTLLAKSLGVSQLVYAAFVQDILDTNGSFLTFEEFQSKFKIKRNFLQYFQLMAAIPSDLKKKAQITEKLELLNTTTVPGTLMDLASMRCKHYYKIIKAISSNHLVSKSGKLSTLSILNNGKINFHLYMNRQEIIN